LARIIEATSGSAESPVGGGMRSNVEIVSRLEQRADSESERPALTVEQFLAWVDAYPAVHGAWPDVRLMAGLGPIDAAPGETWKAINFALGQRGLPGDSSLAELLAKHRVAPALDVGARALLGKLWAWEQNRFPVKKPKLRLRSRPVRPTLTISPILEWADAFRSAHGRWPSHSSGPIEHAPGETWSSLIEALNEGILGPRGRDNTPRTPDRASWRKDSQPSSEPERPASPGLGGRTSRRQGPVAQLT
jgi:hypothetical protein